VAIVEYGDFGCPSCPATSPRLEEVADVGEIDRKRRRRHAQSPAVLADLDANAAQHSGLRAWALQGGRYWAGSLGTWPSAVTW
jgi:hypothetical protein